MVSTEATLCFAVNATKLSEPINYHRNGLWLFVSMYAPLPDFGYQELQNLNLSSLMLLPLTRIYVTSAAAIGQKI